MNIQLEKLAYDTSRELAFIRGLAGGGFSDMLHHNPKESLTKYLASCEKRVVWDGVDKEACIKYAMVLLGAM